MATPFTRIHQHLGIAPGPLTFEQVCEAAEGGLEEAENLDWKRQLPSKPGAGEWSEFVKDVVAMANTAGGLLVYGITDDGELVGVEERAVAPANIRSLTQQLNNRVRPYVDGVTFYELKESDGERLLLIVDVPASEVAPHFIYGTAEKEKNQRTAVIPERIGSDTMWMEEHQVAHAYRERFGRHEGFSNRLEEMLEFVTDQCFREDQARAWLVMAAAPARKLRGQPIMDRHKATDLATAALRSGLTIQNTLNPSVEVLRSLESAGNNPRCGYRRWVMSNFQSTADQNSLRPVYLEQHFDGSCALAVDLSWKLAEASKPDGIYFAANAVDAAAADFVGLVGALSTFLMNNSAVEIRARMVGPTATDRKFSPVWRNPNGVTGEPDWSRRIRLTQLASVTVPHPE
ncbi:helix-turn-helix domain-containing protein [Arthrobacter sp. 2RAF6]|uniref:AlbA family DNA-binding domain-containing protein n=1 Tax=Arthrobacter sp. 2RAF6 TaxID=3233002 RepID=UPI003F932058